MSKYMFAVWLSIVSATASAEVIVVLGDSISAGYGIEAGKNWVNLIEKKLEAEKFPHRVFNESISGDTSAGGLARIDSTLARHKPQWLLLELGANDGLRGLTPQQMKANLTEIVLRSQKAGAQVLLLGMRLPPNYGKRYIDIFYNIYPALAKEFNLSFVPFILEDVALDKALMQPDRLHPNTAAQPIIAEKIWGYLKPLLK
ncbi:arylesterase [Methylicorpusculum sp.]|uniref:arylesterase n=1 Tax=Methylicorpusculum sp. TaxID=2713644 RepID=UPI00271AFE22|nr:arylesterase [Methylicorpusculum sp.]MDO9240831.1 arylesterase [Methylicorpusculum sp.]MDP2177846.1 arylesterase [Methylicorpusculum sp.]MDP3529886.1 arylesterase [Methylicorpusculum sp.]MDZ4153806.1 arylesterase [Methylicorpusculum sp.]